MKTLSQTPNTAAITPAVVILGILIAGVVLAAISGRKIPLLSNIHFDLVVLLVLGMAMCTPGIGRVAALNAWGHPLSILGMVLGAAILVIMGSVFLNFRLPLIATEQQALLWTAGLIAAKVINSAVHNWLIR